MWERVAVSCHLSERVTKAFGGWTVGAGHTEEQWYEQAQAVHACCSALKRPVRQDTEAYESITMLLSYKTKGH